MTSKIQKEAERIRSEKGLTGPVFKEIEAKKAYDRDTFIKYFKELRDVKKDFEAYRKDDKDYKAAHKLGKRVWGNPKHYFQEGVFSDPRYLVEDVQTRIENASEAMDWHVYYNRNSLLDVLEKDEKKKSIKDQKLFRDIVLKTMPFSTESGGTEHDDLVGIVRRYQTLDQIARSEDPNERYNAMVQIVWGDMSKLDPTGAATGTLERALRSQQYVASQFSRILSAEKAVVGSILTHDVARKFLLKNMEMAERVYEQETDDRGDQDDLKKMALMPILDQIAPAAYKIVKAEKDQEKDDRDPKEHKKNKRVAERRERGFPL